MNGCPQRKELPTAEDIIAAIINNEAGREKLKTAYYESFTFRERGGWIFINPSDPTEIEVVLAQISASDSFRATDMMTTPSINLEDISTNGVPPGQNRADRREGGPCMKWGGGIKESTTSYIAIYIYTVFSHYQAHFAYKRMLFCRPIHSLLGAFRL